MSCPRFPPFQVCAIVLLCFLLESICDLQASYTSVHATSFPFLGVHTIMRILGSTMLGRLSDCIGREALLWVVALGCIISSYASTRYTAAAWPFLCFSFFSRAQGILKALVGDWCYALDTSNIETALFYGSFNFVTYLCWSVCVWVSVGERTWTQLNTGALSLSLASVVIMASLSRSVFRSSLLEDIWNEFPKATVWKLFCIRSLRTSAVLWILGWLLLQAYAGFLFCLVWIQLGAEPAVNLVGITTDSSKTCVALALLMAIVVIQLSGRAKLRHSTVFATLGMFCFFSRSIEFWGLHEHKNKVVEAAGNFRVAFIVLGSVLTDALLVFLVPRDELGSIFGITNAILGLLAGDGPTIASHIFWPDWNLWVLLAASLTVYMLLVPYAMCVGQCVKFPHARCNSTYRPEDGLETAVADLEPRGSDLEAALLSPYGAHAVQCAGTSVSAHDSHDDCCVGSVHSALTGEKLPIDFYASDTVKSLRQRASRTLNVQAWRVSLLNGMHVLNDDAELPWITPFAGPRCCTLTFLVDAVDLEGIRRAMEAACREWCTQGEGEDIEHAFLCMSTPFPVCNDHTASMRFKYVSRGPAESNVDEGRVEYDMRCHIVVRILP